jgi:hypothetical protein
MADIRKTAEQTRDYRERFEFRLTVGDNIICQRYFRINNFNPVSLRSFDLPETIRACADMIDKDLKEKTQVYLELYSPKVFQNREEMDEYFSNEENRKKMMLGEGIVIKGDERNYFWSGEKGPAVAEFKFDDGEFSNELSDEDIVEYKFSFYDNGWNMDEHREVCSVVWDGIYPKFVRNQIDLSNKKYRYDDDDTSRLSWEQYLLYKMCEGKSDLVWRIIKEICFTCSSQDDKWYTLMEPIKKVAKKEEK